MNEDPNHWSVVDVLKGHAAEVTSGTLATSIFACVAHEVTDAFSPLAVIWFQQTLITGSKDKTIRLWRAPTKDSLVQ